MRIGRRALIEGASAIAWNGAIAYVNERSALADEFLLRHGGAPQNLATDTAFFDRLITPTPVFFVRSHFGPPSPDRARKLAVTGMVKTPLSFRVDELPFAFKEVTVTAVLQCAGNGRALHRPRVP